MVHKIQKNQNFEDLFGKSAESKTTTGKEIVWFEAT